MALITASKHCDAHGVAAGSILVHMGSGTSGSPPITKYFIAVFASTEEGPARRLTAAAAAYAAAGDDSSFADLRDIRDESAPLKVLNVSVRSLCKFSAEWRTLIAVDEVDRVDEDRPDEDLVGCEVHNLQVVVDTLFGPTIVIVSNARIQRSNSSDSLVVDHEGELLEVQSDLVRQAIAAQSHSSPPPPPTRFASIMMEVEVPENIVNALKKMPRSARLVDAQELHDSG
jgi:hypothetical protein